MTYPISAGANSAAASGAGNRAADGRASAGLPVLARLESRGETQDAGEDGGFAPPGMLPRFENQCPRAFAVNHTVAPGIEWAAGRGRIAAVLRVAHHVMAGPKGRMDLRPNPAGNHHVGLTAA